MLSQEVLNIAKGFDSNVCSVEKLVRYRNRIYKADCGSYNIILRATSTTHRSINQINAELRFQNFLYENGASVSRPISYHNGEWCTEAIIEEEECIISAFSFVEGKDWNERDDIDPKVLYNIGKELGKIHALAKTYVEADQSRRIWYEQQELVKASKLFEEFDPKLKRTFDEFIDQMKLLQENGETFGLTHGDYLISNYLISDTKVTVIDFDECEYSWYGMDLAICMRCYLLGEDPQNLANKCDLAEMIFYNLLLGYSSENTITTDIVYELNRYIAVRDYIELSQLLQAKREGYELGEIEEILFESALDRVMNQKPFITFDLSRIEKLI